MTNGGLLGDTERGELDPVTAAMAAQAQLRAALGTELLGTGALSYKELAQGRQVTAATVRQWVRRAQGGSRSSITETVRPRGLGSPPWP